MCMSEKKTIKLYENILRDYGGNEWIWKGIELVLRTKEQKQGNFLADYSDANLDWEDEGLIQQIKNRMQITLESIQSESSPRNCIEADWVAFAQKMIKQLQLIRKGMIIEKIRRDYGGDEYLWQGIDLVLRIKERKPGNLLADYCEADVEDENLVQQIRKQIKNVVEDIQSEKGPRNCVEADWNWEDEEFVQRITEQLTIILGNMKAEMNSGGESGEKWDNEDIRFAQQVKNI